MNVYQAKQFLTVVKYMNMNRAAEELSVTQPALSMSIARLEKEIGLQLFYRDKKKLVLSENGKKLLAGFKQYVDSHDALNAEIDALKYQKVEKQTLRLGYAGPVYLYMSFSMTPFLKKIEGARVKVYNMEYEDVLRALKEGRLDFALVQDVLEDEAIESVKIYSEEIGLAVSALHPLAGRRFARLADLVQTDMIGFDHAEFFRGFCDRACRRQGFQPHYILEADHAAFARYVREHAHTRDVCAFAAVSSYEESFGKYGGYCFIPLRDPLMLRQVTLSWNKSSNMIYENRDFVEYIKREYPKQHSLYISAIDTFEKGIPAPGENTGG